MHPELELRIAVAAEALGEQAQALHRVDAVTRHFERQQRVILLQKEERLIHDELSLLGGEPPDLGAVEEIGE